MLKEKTIAITRSKDDASEFIKLARQGGAVPIPLPTIELVSRGQKIADEFLGSIDSFDPDYSVFMSSKAVKLLFDAARESGRLQQLQLAVANTTVISVGPKTGIALQEQGIKANHQPKETFSSVGIGEEFTRIHAAGKKAIIPRSGASTPFLKELLNKIGIDVLEVYLYDVCAFKDTSQWNHFRELFSQNRIDGVIFTSASSVRGFFEIMSQDHDRHAILEGLSQSAIVSIGPFTSDELEKFSVKNTISPVHTVAGAVDAMNDSL